MDEDASGRVHQIEGREGKDGRGRVQTDDRGRVQRMNAMTPPYDESMSDHLSPADAKKYSRVCLVIRDEINDLKDAEHDEREDEPVGEK
jgi:hypothetical protein